MKKAAIYFSHQIKLTMLIVLFGSANTGVAKMQMQASAMLPPTSKFSIENVVIQGSGCPENISSQEKLYHWDEKSQQLSIEFDQFQIERPIVTSAGNSAPTQACTVALQIMLPDGYTLAIGQLSYQGSLQLPEGTSAQLWSRIYLPGSGQPDQFEVFEFHPPQPDEFTVTNNPEPVLWTACGGSQLLSVQVRLLLQPASLQQTARIRLEKLNMSQFKMLAC